MIGDSGFFDYAEFCAEYAAFDAPMLYHMARAAQCGNLPLMIKPDQESQGFWTQAALGAGFKAVLFTDIRSEADIDECHRIIRPDTPDQQGNMGVKLRRPALTSYDTTAYLEDLASVVFCIMLEKDIAMANLDAILSRAAEKGVDMVQWGPADFGFSRGQPTLMSTPDIRPFEERVISQSLAHGIRPRIEIGATEQAKRYLDLGVRDFCLGWDRFILRTQLGALGESMTRLLEDA